MTWQCEGRGQAFALSRLRSRHQDKSSCWTRVEEKNGSSSTDMLFLKPTPPLCMSKWRVVCPSVVRSIYRYSVPILSSTGKNMDRALCLQVRSASMNHRWRRVRRQNPLLLDSEGEIYINEHLNCHSWTIGDGIQTTCRATATIHLSQTEMGCKISKNARNRGLPCSLTAAPSKRCQDAGSTAI